jgi:hypothetical protein
MNLAALALALTASAVGLTDPELADALKGGVPTHTEAFVTPAGKSAGRGVGAVVVDRAVGDVWATLTRYEDKAEYQPRVKSVAVLDKLPDRVRARFTIDASITTARYTAWFVFDERAHAIHWTLDGSAPDNTIAAVDGCYRLFEIAPAQTLVVYQAYVDSGRAIPRSIQEYVARKSIPNLLRAVKRRIESGGVYKK